LHSGERFKAIAAEALYEKLAMGEPFCIVDVRTESEYAEAHIPGSILMPLHELPTRLTEVPSIATNRRHRTIVVGRADARGHASQPHH